MTYMQLPQPYMFISFTLRNGRWYGSTQQEYRGGTWFTRRVTYRYNWRSWSRRQLSGSRGTDYSPGDPPVQKRDTLLYTRVGTDTVVYRTTETRGSNGQWSVLARRRWRTDSQRNVTVWHERDFFNHVPMGEALDSTACLYDAQHQLRRQQVYTNYHEPYPLVYDGTAYYAAAPLTSTSRPAAALPLMLSPNPATRQLTLAVPALPDSGPVEVDIVTALGQVVARRTVRPRTGTLLETWDVRGWPAGLYVLRLHAATGTTTRRFLKQ